MHGTDIVTLEQPWSVMVRMELYPCEMGSLAIKLIATVLNGIALGFVNMG